MKRILLFFSLFLVGTFLYGDVCTQTFSGNGQDDDPTTVTVVPGDISCTGGGTITNVVYKNSAGSLTNSNCGSWYQFHLKVDGAEVAVGCAADLDGTVISAGFSTIELTSEDLDAYSDGVTLTFDLEVTYTPPSCPAPTALTASNITAATADLGWTTGGASNWEVVVQAAGGAAPSGSGTATATNPYAATGLSPNTDYEFYVRDYCNPDYSTWSGPFAFTTLCAVMTPDYIEDFASMTSSNPPSCWEEGSGPVTGPTSTGSSTWVSDGFANNGSSGSARINLYSASHKEWLMSPLFDLSAGGYELKFDVAVTAFSGTAASAMGSDDEVQLLYTEDGGTTWTNLMTWDASNTPSNTGDAIQINLALTGTSVQFAFWATDGSTNDTEDYNFYVDNFVVQTPPSCPAPTVLTASNITSTTADLGWTTGGASNWEVVVQAAGGAAPSGSGTATATNPYTATGLTPNTAYEFYVRDYCNPDYSTWAGPFAFTTACGIMSVPYSMDFETNADCWTVLDANGDGKTWLYGTGVCGSKGLRTTYSATGVVMDDWAFSPALDLTGGTEYLISFNSGNNSTTYIEKMKVFLMDAADPATANQIMIYNDDNINDNACNQSNVQIVAPAGWANYYVGFYAYSDGNQYFLYMDDFSIDVAPAESTWTPEDNNANTCDLYTINGVAGSDWHHIYNGANHVASINSNGQDLGSVFVDLRDAGTTVEEHTEQGSGNMKKTMPKFFNLDAEKVFVNPVTVRLYFTDGELSDFNTSTLGSGASSFAATDLDVTHYDGLNENCDVSDNDAGGTYNLIDNANITVGNVSGGFYLQFDVSSFSELTAHEPAAAPLPIELSAFEGQLMGRSNLLTWTTETERNAGYFEIQRSNSGSLDFETIGRVDAKGSSSVSLSYNFEDKSPSKLAYYRLKLVDLDGSYEYSNVISLLRKEKGFDLFGAYPVPTNGDLTVEFTTEKPSEMSVVLTDIAGRVILTEKFESISGIQKHHVDMSALALGTYFVKLSDGQATMMQRVVKQ